MQEAQYAINNQFVEGAIVYHCKIKALVGNQQEKKSKFDLSEADEYDQFKFYNMKEYDKAPTRIVSSFNSDSNLIFNSNFECGNLRRAVKVNDFEYNLYLEHDTETCSHTQWFYFSITNTKPNKTVKFNVVNLIKYESLYMEGMQPFIWSKQKNEKEGTEWYRGGFNITYTQNVYKRSAIERIDVNYTLTFYYTFEYENDYMYFAHFVPYTYQQLLDYFSCIRNDFNLQQISKVSLLCYTLAGNKCEMITITEDIDTYKGSKIQEYGKNKNCKNAFLKHKNKKGIIITARVHPGECNSSWICKGIIDFLLSDELDAQKLRKAYVFKIIPMLNPDGVIYGNSRTNLLGIDLNRRWNNPNSILHPTIYYTKSMLKLFQNEIDLKLYCDIHGHSRKKDVFMYGCAYNEKEPTNNIKNKNSQQKNQYYDSKSVWKNLMIKIVPLLLSEQNKMFSFKKCKFRIEKAKEAAARVVVFRELGVLHSYTMEASFYGPAHIQNPENRNQIPNEQFNDSQFSPQHLEQLGVDFCKVLLSLIDSKDINSKFAQFQRKLKSNKFLFTPTLSSQIKSKKPNDLPLFSDLDTKFSNRKEDKQFTPNSLSLQQKNKQSQSETFKIERSLTPCNDSRDKKQNFLNDTAEQQILNHLIQPNKNNDESKDNNTDQMQPEKLQISFKGKQQQNITSSIQKLEIINKQDIFSQTFQSSNLKTNQKHAHQQRNYQKSLAQDQKASLANASIASLQGINPKISQHLRVNTIILKHLNKTQQFENQHHQNKTLYELQSKDFKIRAVGALKINFRLNLQRSNTANPPQKGNNYKKDYIQPSQQQKEHIDNKYSYMLNTNLFKESSHESIKRIKLKKQKEIRYSTNM